MSKQGKPYELRTKSDSRANQWVSNPKQEKMLDYYFDTTSTGTFSNVYQSAIKAGYSESYARTLSSPSVNNLWLKNNNRTSLTTNHITRLVESIAMSGARDGDKLRALELLAKIQGMIVDKSQSLNLNIETALKDLK